MWRKRLGKLLLLLACGSLLRWGLTPANSPAPVAAQSSTRLVMKNGELWVMVQDTETAAARALDFVTTYQGYVLSQRAWLQNSYRYSDITVGVPVADFEALLADFKGLGAVQGESISGQDVTDETVDLESRVTNLDSNQERTRGFLDQTDSITETLHVFQSLRAIESEIGSLQGRQNLLEDRAAAATITLHLLPWIPTPTPTPTATPTPLPTPQAWNPGDTAQTAVTSLRNDAQNTADFFIYRTILCGPWLLLLALVLLVTYRGGRRVRKWFASGHGGPGPELGDDHV